MLSASVFSYLLQQCAFADTSTGIFDLLSADVVFEGVDRHGDVGETLIPVGDFNGDGYDDVLIGGPFTDYNGVVDSGSAFLLYGGPQSDQGSVKFSPSTAGVWFHGNAQRKSVGYTVGAAGDLNGDGLDDILISEWPLGPKWGGYGPYEVHLIYGRSASDVLTGVFDIDNADATFQLTQREHGEGISWPEDVGFGLSRVGDLDGDGVDDLAIGAHWTEADDKDYTGETYIFYGNKDQRFSGLVDSTAANAVLVGEYEGQKSGWAIGPELDFDGDGRNDLLITAPTGETSYLIYGNATVPRLSGRINLSEADLQLEGMRGGDRTGESVSAGDFNGDGFDDIVLGARGYDIEGFENVGRAYIVLGADGGNRKEGVVRLADSADLIIAGNQQFTGTGASLASAGDVNGDGFDDLLISAPSADPAGRTNAGEVYLIYGRSNPAFYEGILDTSDADAVLRGDWYSLAGSSVASAGDFNGDGLADMLIGAPLAGPTSAGAAYIVFGKPVPEPGSGAVAVSALAFIAGRDIGRRKRPFGAITHKLLWHPSRPRCPVSTVLHSTCT